MKQNEDEKFIHINDNWAFQGDQLAITLFEKKVNKKGKLGFYARGHFNNLQQVYSRLIDMEINSARTLELMVDQIASLKQDIFTSLDSLRAKSDDDQVARDLLDRPGIIPPKKDGT
ncbi:MAG: hypothetical protein JRJ39_00520 [Deltaproteobacteria bacterium]|nr:hypothetical protein [Deltaproteobacteria bacterium]MBW1845593.1 hypothetical protein [Deltaproteobacteria bacterium]MBW2032021.1 hypothetical protein [Deltaproteobacteria bacterium]